MKRWIIGTATVVVVLLVSALTLTGPVNARADNASADKASATSNELAVDAARNAVEAYLTGEGLEALDVGTIITFSNHTYVAVIDPATGNGALELIVQQDGAVHPQRTLMWNTTYHAVLAGQPGMTQHNMSGMMNGMNGVMGGGQHSQMHDGQGAMPQHGAGMMDHDRQHNMDGAGAGTADQDRLRMMDPAECQRFAAQTDPAMTLDEPLNVGTVQTAAQEWLNANQPGTSAGQVMAFPGYFTVQVMDAGQVTGLISVQATTGQVMSQDWHGNIVSMS